MKQEDLDRVRAAGRGPEREIRARLDGRRAAPPPRVPSRRRRPERPPARGRRSGSPRPRRQAGRELLAQLLVLDAVLEDVLEARAPAGNDPAVASAGEARRGRPCEDHRGIVEGVGEGVGAGRPPSARTNGRTGWRARPRSSGTPPDPLPGGERLLPARLRNVGQGLDDRYVDLAEGLGRGEGVCWVPGSVASDRGARVPCRGSGARGSEAAQAGQAEIDGTAPRRSPPDLSKVIPASLVPSSRVSPPIRAMIRVRLGPSDAVSRIWMWRSTAAPLRRRASR
jgi:hypothetical protein